MLRRNLIWGGLGGAGAVGADLRRARARRSPTPRCRATRKRVRALLKQAADVNGAQGDGMTALHWAAMKNDADLAQLLLYAGANVRATTRIGAYTPLVLAAKKGMRR